MSEKTIVHTAGTLRIKTPNRIITIRVNEQGCRGVAVNSVMITDEVPAVLAENGEHSLTAHN